LFEVVVGDADVLVGVQVDWNTFLVSEFDGGAGEGGAWEGVEEGVGALGDQFEVLLLFEVGTEAEGGGVEEVGVEAEGWGALGFVAHAEVAPAFEEFGGDDEVVEFVVGVEVELVELELAFEGGEVGVVLLGLFGCDCLQGGAEGGLFVVHV
jgi:hypothetical protein